MSLVRRASTVGAWTLVSRVCGMVRERLLAGAFTGDPRFSAFLVAFQLPNLLRNLFGEGALSAAFVPRYVQTRLKDPALAETFAGTVLARLAIFLGLLALAGMVAAGVVLAAGGGQVAAVAALAIPMLPYLVFICVTAIAGGVLHGRGRFAVPAATPVLLNLSMIAMVLIWPTLEVLAWAVLLAGLLQLAMQFLALHRTGGIPPAQVAATPEERELRRALGPVLIASGAFQFNALIDQVIALRFVLDGLGPQFLFFANRLIQLPMALVGYGVGAALSPDLAAAALRGWPECGPLLRRSLRLQVLVMIPAAAGLLVAAEPLVRVLYQTGNFQAVHAERLVLVVRMLALSLVPEACNKLFVRLFHAHRLQRVPMHLGFAQVAVNLILNLILVQTPLREAGLALSTSIACGLACVTYGLLIHRRGIGRLIDLDAWLRPLLASVLMMGAVAWVLHLYPYQPQHRFLDHLLRLCVALATGAAVYLVAVGRTTLRRGLRGG